MIIYNNPLITEVLQYTKSEKLCIVIIIIKLNKFKNTVPKIFNFLFLSLPMTLFYTTHT